MTPLKNEKNILNLWPVVKKATCRQLITDKWISVRNGIWAPAVILHMRNAVSITWPWNQYNVGRNLRGSSWPSCGLSHALCKIIVYLDLWFSKYVQGGQNYPHNNSKILFIFGTPIFSCAQGRIFLGLHDMEISPWI